MEKRICAVCGRPAIGMQIFGCCASEVCEEHADAQLRSLKRGERRDAGACYFYRYE